MFCSATNPPHRFGRCVLALLSVTSPPGTGFGLKGSKSKFDKGGSTNLDEFKKCIKYCDGKKLKKRKTFSNFCSQNMSNFFNFRRFSC